MLTGRWHKVRQWNPGGWGQPWMLDRKWATLRPYDTPEWWYDHKRQVWLPAIGGGTIVGGYQTGQFAFGLGVLPSGFTATNLALDSAYTYGSAGDAIGTRATVVYGETLNSVYFRVASYTGTAANVNDLNFELRNETSGLPGSTLHTSATKDPASATGWIAITGLSFAMTAANSPYWAILGDADGNATHNASVQRSMNAAITGSATSAQASQSTDGWLTQSAQNAPGSLLLVFASGRTLGSPFSAASLTANTNRKGYRIGGFTTAVTIFGIILPVDADHNRAEWWSGSAGPGGTATQTSTLRGFGDSTAANVVCMLFSGGLALSAGATGRLVTDSSSGGTTSARRLNIGTGEDATLRSAMLGAGDFYYTEANGTTDWSNDLVGSLPIGDLLLEDTVAAGGGSGGGLNLVGAGGLVG